MAEADWGQGDRRGVIINVASIDAYPPVERRPGPLRRLEGRRGDVHQNFAH
jgi:hypothetical protein